MKKIKNKILLLMSLCVFCGCVEACEDCDDVTYHKTIGEGYIMFYDDDGNLQPIQGVGIIVRNDLGYGGNFFTPSVPQDTFYTDGTGKFQIRFMKRTRCRDVIQYYLSTSWGWELSQTYYGYWANNYYFPQLCPDDIKNTPNNVVLFDTMKLEKRY